MRRSSGAANRGGSKLGCLAAILLFAALGYAAYRVVPVYMEQDAFHDALLEVAGRATMKGYDTRVITRQVLELAKVRRFDLAREDIQIERIRGRPEVVIRAEYSRTEWFPFGYSHTFKFRSVAQGSLGL